MREQTCTTCHFLKMKVCWWDLSVQLFLALTVEKIRILNQGRCYLFMYLFIRSVSQSVIRLSFPLNKCKVVSNPLWWESCRSPDRNHFSAARIKISPNKKSECNKRHKPPVHFFAWSDQTVEKRRPAENALTRTPRDASCFSGGRYGNALTTQALRGHKTHSKQRRRVVGAEFDSVRAEGRGARVWQAIWACKRKSCNFIWVSKRDSHAHNESPEHKNSTDSKASPLHFFFLGHPVRHFQHRLPAEWCFSDDTWTQRAVFAVNILFFGIKGSH